MVYQAQLRELATTMFTKRESPNDAAYSEQALANDWLNTEEDEAWKHLQSKET